MPRYRDRQDFPSNSHFKTLALFTDSLAEHLSQIVDDRMRIATVLFLKTRSAPLAEPLPKENLVFIMRIAEILPAISNSDLEIVARLTISDEKIVSRLDCQCQYCQQFSHPSLGRKRNLSAVSDHQHNLTRWYDHQVYKFP
jgi:hypothetical protein